MRLIGFATALAAVLLAALWPSTARACSCVGGVRAVAPADGASGVPLNLQARLLHASNVESLELLQGGAAVPVQFGPVDPAADTSVVYLGVTPEQPLQPLTTYELWVNGTVASTFVTGSGRDETPPEGGSVLDQERVKSSGGNFLIGVNSCGGSDGYRLELAEARDDQAEARDVWYHVYAARPGEDLDLSRPRTVLPPGSAFLGDSLCNQTFLMQGRSNVEVRLVPVDLAGNEGPRFQHTLSSCGCAASGASPLALLAPALLALAALRSGRRLHRRD